MADIKKFLPYLQIEGKYNNDKSDSGGPTMRGITWATFVQYRNQKGLPLPSITDLKNISNETWEDIVKTMYWNKWHADQIYNQSIANILADWFFNSGYWGIKIPQRILGLKEDGIVGSKTLDAVNIDNQAVLFQDIKKAREQFYWDIVKNKPSQNKFIKGWINRLNQFTFEA